MEELDRDRAVRVVQHQPVRTTPAFRPQRTSRRDYSILILADRMTLPHFSVSSAMSLPNSAAVIDSGRTPKSTRRPRVSGSATMALIVVLSLSTMALGVATGAQMP